MKTQLFRASLLVAAVCTAAATTATFAQMDGGTMDKPAMDKPAMAGGMKDMKSDMMDMKAGMQADMQMKDALMKIKAADPEKAGDMMFVLENAGGNMFEAAFSKLVASKTQDPKIKELTMMVEKDHMMANDKLKGIAEKMGLMLPTSLPSEKMQKLDTLSALPPADLDKTYLMMQRAIHAHDVTMFEDHATMVKDPELKAYIAEVTPKLQEHAMHINMCAKDKGAAADMTPADTAGKKM